MTSYSWCKNLKEDERSCTQTLRMTFWPFAGREVENLQPPSPCPMSLVLQLWPWGFHNQAHDCFFNITTSCLPGATIPVILDKLPGLLHSPPSSTQQLTLQVKMNEAVCWGPEVTEKDFNDRYSQLKSCWKAVSLSDLSAVHSGHMVRHISLHTWLQIHIWLHPSTLTGIVK